MTPSPENAQQSRRPPTKDRELRRVASAILPGGGLAEMVFSPEDQGTSFCVFEQATWRTEGSLLLNGERVVPYRAANNLLQHDVVLFPSEPEDYGAEADLLAAIRAFIHRHVVLSPGFETIASHYVLLSWVYDRFNELPYLRVRGDFGSGKTRFLQTVGSLCYKPIFASGASTVSPLFRILDAFRGTLVLDESDFRFSDEKAELTKILNNGNARGFPVLRSEAVNQREFDPRAYAVFGPKLIASRGYFEDRALESRCITEEMGERGLRDEIPISLPATFAHEARHLRNRLLLFRFQNHGRVGIATDSVDRTIEPRLNQIFLPLLSIIEDPATKAEIRALARETHAGLVAERGLDLEANVLEVVRDLVGRSAAESVSIKDVTNAFVERYGEECDRKVTPKWIGSVIRKRLHLATYRRHGVYVIGSREGAKLARLCEKYGLEAPAAPATEQDRGRGDGGDVPGAPSDAAR